MMVHYYTIRLKISLNPFWIPFKKRLTFLKNRKVKENKQNKLTNQKRALKIQVKVRKSKFDEFEIPAFITAVDIVVERVPTDMIIAPVRY